MIPPSFAGDAQTIGLEEGRSYRDALERIIWGRTIPDIWSANPKTDPQIFRRALRSAFPPEGERIEAICRGAVLDPMDLLPIYGQELGAAFRFCPPFTALIAAVPHDRLDGGVPAVGTNIDIPIFLLPFLVTRKYLPRDSYPRIEVSLLTLAGAIAGINGQGLAVALSLKPFEGDGKGLIPLSLVVREALKKCKDAKGALRLIGSSPRGASGTIVLADSYSVIVIELTPRALASHELKGGFFISSSHFLLPGMMSRDLPHLTVYPRTAPAELIEKRIYDVSEKRVDQTLDLIDSRRQWDPKGLGEVLSDREHEVFLSSGFYKTCVSALLIPAQKTVFFATPQKQKFSRMFL